MKPIAYDKTDVKLRGEPLDEVWWQGRQWAVTAHGLEARDGEVYSRQAKNVENERRACEIRLRAERKAGQLLKEREKAKGGQPYQSTSRSVRGVEKTLAELGVSETQSSRWQGLADVPEDQFEAAFAGSDMPTTSGILASTKTEKPRDKVDEQALWLWGRLQDFDPCGTRQSSSSSHRKTSKNGTA